METQWMSQIGETDKALEWAEYGPVVDPGIIRRSLKFQAGRQDKWLLNKAKAGWWRTQYGDWMSQDRQKKPKIQAGRRRLLDNWKIKLNPRLDNGGQTKEQTMPQAG